MATARSLHWLYRLREAEEQQKGSALVSAVQELRRLEGALTVAHTRERRGRLILNESLCSAGSQDRVVGLEEIAAADRQAAILAVRIHKSRERIAEIRREFLATRVKRRQVEILLEEDATRGSAEEKRKSQMALDDWYRSRRIADCSNRIVQMHAQPEPAVTPKPENT